MIDIHANMRDREQSGGRVRTDWMWLHNLASRKGLTIVETLADPYKGRSLYLVFPITENKTFPAISYRWALIILLTDKEHSPMESAWNYPFQQLLQNSLINF